MNYILVLKAQYSNKQIGLHCTVTYFINVSSADIYMYYILRNNNFVIKYLTTVQSIIKYGGNNNEITVILRNDRTYITDNSSLVLHHF